jgi:hypothetical protein
MRQFLSKVLLIDVEDEDTFVYRVCGTEIADANRKDLTGQQANVANLGSSYPQFMDAYRRATRSRQPVYFTGRMWWQGREYVAFEQIILPLSADGATVDKLMCVVDFDLQHIRSR